MVRTPPNKYVRMVLGVSTSVPKKRLTLFGEHLLLFGADVLVPNSIRMYSIMDCSYLILWVK